MADLIRHLFATTDRVQKQQTIPYTKKHAFLKAF